MSACGCMGHTAPQDPNDEPFSLAMGAYPRGRCDTCGAPCCDHSGDCIVDATHITGIEG